jgi:hypothetical protein
MSTTPDTAPPQRLAVLALDVTGGDVDAVDAVLARVAQVFRHGVERGVVVGVARHVLVPDLTADDFFAALASRKARDE